MLEKGSDYIFNVVKNPQEARKEEGNLLPILEKGIEYIFNVGGNRDLSESLQKKLFELGYSWSDGVQEPKFFNNAWIIARPEDGFRLTWGNNPPGGSDCTQLCPKEFLFKTCYGESPIPSYSTVSSPQELSVMFGEKDLVTRGPCDSGFIPREVTTMKSRHQGPSPNFKIPYGPKEPLERLIQHYQSLLAAPIEAKEALQLEASQRAHRALTIDLFNL